MREWVARVDQAETAAARHRVVADIARAYGLSESQVYRRLRQAGWESGRRRRQDSGVSQVDEATLHKIAALMRSGVRQNGTATMPLNVARSIMAENGCDFPISDARLRCLIRESAVDTDPKAVTPHVGMRSLHPNHVHQCDPSRALMYFSPGGRQHRISELNYKNKRWKRAGLWRYVLTDHYSASICIRYYEAEGEKQENLWDFLLYAWGQKSDPLYAFHGVPKILVWDKGSANTSRAATRALESLGVETLAHEQGNPRAKGQVERSNFLVEQHFESRLRVEPVSSLEELNGVAERFCAAWNSGTIAGIDSRLSRHGTTVGRRAELWQRISDEQLLELPESEICRMLFTHDPVFRRVDSNLYIRYAHPSAGSLLYSLHHLPDIEVGDDVEVRPLLYASEAGAVVVRHRLRRNGEVLAREVLPLELDEAGFAADAAVWGEEYQRQSDRPSQIVGKELDVLAYGSSEPGADERPFAYENDGKGLAAHSFIGRDRPDIIPQARRGSPAGALFVDRFDIRITCAEAARRIRSRSGWLPNRFLETLKREYPDGLTTENIETIAAELIGQADNINQQEA